MEDHFELHVEQIGGHAFSCLVPVQKQWDSEIDNGTLEHVQALLGFAERREGVGVLGFRFCPIFVG